MLSERIKESRKKRGLTQDQLAKFLNVQRSVVSKYESGLVEPSVSQLQRIATALDVTMSYLTGEPIRLDIPMPDYPFRLPTKEEIDRMAPAEQEYYYLRLLADTEPDKLKKIYSDIFDKLNKLGQVEAVRRVMELAERQQYTESEPRTNP